MAAAKDDTVTVQWREDETQLHLTDIMDSTGSVAEFVDMLVADKVQFAAWWSVGVRISLQHLTNAMPATLLLAVPPLPKRKV
jgi:hypothetical protein